MPLAKGRYVPAAFHRNVSRYRLDSSFSSLISMSKRMGTNRSETSAALASAFVLAERVSAQSRLEQRTH